MEAGRAGWAPLREPEPPGEGEGRAGDEQGFSLSLSAVLKGAARDAAVGARPGLRGGDDPEAAATGSCGARHGGREPPVCF